MGRLRSRRATARGPLILADTSAWVEYDRGTGSIVHRRMHDLTAPKRGLVVTAPVVAELVMGARTEAREQELRSMLAAFGDLRFRGATDLDAGASIYRMCRRAGVTPGGLMDCVIAGIAMRADAALLTADLGQARIAEALPLLRLDPASVTP